MLFLVCSGYAQEEPRADAEKMVAAAIEQIGVTIHYDGSYQAIGYPGGDVPLDRGVCTDVLVRAFRRVGVDLQVLVHEDMLSHFPQYPQDWGLQGPDRNIDHRRVLNLMCFFSRHDCDCPITPDGTDYLPGDIVTWELSPGLYHIGIVSNRPAGDLGRFLIVHNVGLGTQLEDFLFAYTVIGHYRFF